MKKQNKQNVIVILMISSIVLIVLIIKYAKKIMKYARGHLNNNPFNLVKSVAKWQGKLTVSSDKRFEQFESLELGIRAGYKNLLNIYKAKGFNTPSSIIGKYSPVADKDNAPGSTQKYAEFIAKKLGVEVDEPVKNWPDLGFWIMHYENGYNVVSRAQYDNILKKYQLV